MKSDEAIAVLREPYCDFTFQHPNGFAHTLALSLTLLVRPYITGPVPMFGVFAACAGTGKSLLTRLAVAMATGQAPPDAQFPKDDAEVRKMITTKLMHGGGVLCFDNVDGEVKSHALESAITSSDWSDRTLGSNTWACYPNNLILVLNGNNTVLGDALARRTIPVLLDTSAEKPYMRTGFKYKNVLNHVSQNQSLYFAALSCIVQTWLDAGAPMSVKSLGSFEDWTGKIGGILEYNRIDGFLDGIESFQDTTDMDTGCWNALTAAWYETHQSEPIAPALIHTIAEGLSHDYPFGFLTPHSFRGQISALGRELQSKRNRVYGGRKIIHHGQDKHTKKQLYRLDSTENGQGEYRKAYPLSLEDLGI